jgi:putative ABC transport system permease protein
MALTVIATLTVCIGANTAIFSAVDTLLLKPLPYPAADRLVAIHETNWQRHETEGLMAPVRVAEWASAARTLDGIAGCYFENLTDTSLPLPERVEAMRVSPGFLTLFGTSPLAGRTFSPEEERLVAPVAVISEGFWTRRFGRDPAVGRQLALGGRSYTIVGIMPASFQAPSVTTEVWAPMPPLTQSRAARILTAFGRLKPEMSAADAEADLTRIQADLARQHPQTDAGWAARVTPLQDAQVGGSRRSLWLLFGAVALVLLAACGNLACLLLADAARRDHEIAVRLALGSGRGAVVRQLCLEGLLLASCGAALGLLAARYGVALLRDAAPQLPRLRDVTVDGRIIAFTTGLAALTTLLFSLAPALHATRVDLVRRLAQGGRSVARGRLGAQRILVAVQVTLAVILLTGAGLVVRSFDRLQRTSPGFSPANVLAFKVSAQWSERPEAVAARQFRTLERLRAIPGVTAAAVGSVLPAGGVTLTPQEIRIVEQPSDENRFAEVRMVSGDYFRALQVPVLEGRSCRDDPRSVRSSEILVNRSFSDRFFQDASPIGLHIATGTGISSWAAAIVGVVSDVRERGVASPPEPMTYLCGLMPYWPDPRYLVRVEDPRRVSLTAIRAAIREIEPARAVYAARPLEDFLADAIAQPRLNAMLLSLFAWTTLLLAALGLYGVLSQTVASRRREIGVRMALGARPAQILVSVIVHAATVTGLGIAAGVAGAAALAQVMSSLVFGIALRDPLAFAAAPLVLAIVAAVATIVPARRAAAVDPMAALRDE